MYSKIFSSKEIQIHAKTIEEKNFQYIYLRELSTSIDGRGEKMKKKEEKIGL